MRVKLDLAQIYNLMIQNFIFLTPEKSGLCFNIISVPLKLYVRMSYVTENDSIYKVHLSQAWLEQA